ncbi:hypothetical protein LEMLEM_LOCUS20059 [Lemmus lemmus]
MKKTKELLMTLLQNWTH